MLTTTTAPIITNWTPTERQSGPHHRLTSARDLSAMLAALDPGEISDDTVPLLAAAAAELALVAGIGWRFSTDDPAIALLRVIARATMRLPEGTGPHTERLAAHLSRR